MPFSIDGTIDFSGGQNAGLTSDKIAKNQYYKAVNTSSQNGSLVPRDRFIHTPVNVTTEGKELGITYQEIFDRGKFQGERSFTQGERSFAISVRSGIIFKIDYSLGKATVLRTSTDDRISRYHRRVSIEMAGQYMVIHDWPNQPVLIKDGNARRSNYYAVDSKGLPSPEIPQSRMGIFLQNRYWIVNENEFTAGDPVGNSLTPNAPISFIEVLTPNTGFTGQVFTLGYGYGNEPVTAMGFISSRNSQSKIQATNYGPLYVGTRRSLSIYDAELPRADWTNTTFGRLELNKVGIVGQRAHSIVGSDVMFQDIYAHVHSLTKNQNDERSGWSTTRISREVFNWLNTNNRSYLDIGFITLHNNKIFIGARPSKFPVPTYYGQTVFDYYHEGMVVLELDNVSTIAGAASPSWGGLWTGIRPMEATSIDDNLYVVSKDKDGFNRTYLVTGDEKFDEWHNIKTPPRSRIYLRSFDHEQPFINKTEHSVDVTIGRIDSDLDMALYRRPLHISKFALWDRVKFNPVCETDFEDPVCSKECGSEGLAPAIATGFKALHFANPKEVGCNINTGEPGSQYLETQLLLDIKGSDWEVFKVKLKAEIQGEPDSEGTPCDIKKSVLPIADCNFESDWEIDSVCPFEEPL